MLAGILGGAGLSLAGDLIEQAGAKWLGGGNSFKDPNFMLNQAQQAQQKAQGDALAMIPTLQNQMNSNAMGQTGAAARLGAKTALDGWGNTSGAVQTANTMNRDAGSLRDLGNTQGNLAVSQSQIQGNKLIDGTLNSLRATGGSAKSIAAGAARVAGALGSNSNQLLTNAATTSQQSLTQAANIAGQAQNTLAEDKKLEFEKVTPYLNQMGDVTGALRGITDAGNSAYGGTLNAINANAANGLAAQKQATSMFAGTGAFLGRSGEDAKNMNILQNMTDPSNKKKGILGQFGNIFGV